MLVQRKGWLQVLSSLLWRTDPAVKGARTIVFTSSRPCVPKAKGLLAGVAAVAMFFCGQALAAQPDGPRLPAYILEQQQIQQLRRRIEIVKSEIELNQLSQQLQELQDFELDRIIKQLGGMRSILEANAEVRELLQDSPELDVLYRKILELDSTPTSCRCLGTARVTLLDQDRQTAYIRLDGEHNDTAVGSPIGRSRCLLQMVTDKPSP